MEIQTKNENINLLQTPESQAPIKPIQNSQPRLPKAIAILDNKYCLFHKIGKGGTASVYVGYSPKIQPLQIFSFKIMNPDVIDIPLFQREVKMLNQISHKNVLKLYSYGEGRLQKQNDKVKEVYYLVLEYLEHGELLDFIHLTKGFGEHYTRLMFLSLLDSLEAVHNAGIVHRDIKVDNIMLDSKYNIKLVDFGFATMKNQGQLTTFLGTPNYAAPELHWKYPYYGTCNDIFSLGVTLFIMVTGVLPFKLPLPNDSLYGYIFRNDYEGFWSKRGVEVSDNFKVLFNSMVAYDYTQRPSICEIRESTWMKEINTDLEAILKQELQKYSVVIKEKKRKSVMEKYIKKMIWTMRITTDTMCRVEFKLVKYINKKDEGSIRR